MKKYMAKGSLILCGVAVAISMSACSDSAKKKLGLTKTAPDEFSVVTRAPLAVPPEYKIRPPRPGVKRPMEKDTVEEARQTLFGVEDESKKAKASKSFMEEIGAEDADGSIRERLEVENQEHVEDNRPVAERLMFWGSDAPEGDVIDPKEEFGKMREAEEAE